METLVLCQVSMTTAATLQGSVCSVSQVANLDLTTIGRIVQVFLCN